MTIRYIVRPPTILTTPRKLREVLNAQRTVNPRVSRRSLSFVDDLFLYYPDLPHEVNEYQVIRGFFVKNKHAQQTHLLTSGVKTPETYEPHEGNYVVRPYRHSGGHDFRVVFSDDWDSNTHYGVPLFPKVKEYRVIFVRGRPLITLRKVFLNRTDSVLLSSSVPDASLPWNHSQGASFNTIAGGHEASSLRHSNAVLDLLNVPVVQHAHIIAADIMLNRSNEYAVCELNFCPALTIESNLQTIKEALA